MIMSDNLKNKILEDLKIAMKSGDKVGTSVLRMLNSEIKNKEIDKGASLSDDLVIDVIVSQIKKRRDSITAYQKGGRQDLVEQEKSELDILNKYLPEQMNEDEIRKIVADTISELGVGSQSEMGKVMGVLVPKLKGKADNSLVSKIVKKELGKV